jgi:hypothetical protein
MLFLNLLIYSCKIYIKKGITLKKKYYILTAVQFIFYTFNAEASLSSNKFNSLQELYERSKQLYQEIDPATVSNKDGEAYTRLVHLTIHTYDHYFATQQGYSDTYRRITRQFYDEAISNARKTSSTENPIIFEALKYALLYAEKIIE